MGANKLQAGAYHVLHVFSGYGGGISSLILNLIENKTDNFVFDIMAFSYKDGDVFLQRVRAKGAECFLMPRPRVDGWKKFRLYLEDVFSTHKYDAVHCHIAGWRARPFYSAACRHNVKTFVLHAHTTLYDSKIDRFPPFHIFDMCCNYKYATNYMTCSDLAADYIFGSHYLKKRDAILIPNGINEKFISETLTENQKEIYRTEFSVSQDDTVIAHVGRFSPPKNYDFIIQIAGDLCKISDNFVFLLIGNGELLDEIKEKVKKKGLGNIRFLGRRMDIPLLMQFADCMILPSFYEGLPTVAVECQAAGTRMILSNTITHQCDMHLGLLKFFPITDSDLWIKEILRDFSSNALSQEERLKKITENGFTASASEQIYCDTLKKWILSQKKGTI